MAIEKSRHDIDLIDDEIMSLLEKRFDIVCEIGKEKKKLSLDLENKEREEEILSKAKGKYSDNIVNVYKTIFTESKEIQKDEK